MGLTFGLFLEVVLLIIRTNRPALSTEQRFPALFDKGVVGNRGIAHSKVEAGTRVTKGTAVGKGVQIQAIDESSEVADGMSLARNSPDDQKSYFTKNKQM